MSCLTTVQTNVTSPSYSILGLNTFFEYFHGHINGGTMLHSSLVGTLDHFLSEKVMVFDNFLAADKHK